MGREKEGTRPEWVLPHANPKSLLQELQDRASDCLLFSQVCPGFLPCALCCSSGPNLPPPLLHLLLRRARSSPRMGPIASGYTTPGSPVFFSSSLARPGSISFSKTPCSRWGKLRLIEYQGLTQGHTVSEAEPGLPSPEPGPSQARPLPPGGLGHSQKWHTHRPSPVLQVAEPEPGSELGAWELVVSLQGEAPLQAML